MKSQTLVWVCVCLLISIYSDVNADITGSVYNDYNANSVQEVLELGIEGVVVNAYDDNNVAVGNSPQTTSAAGIYTISGLPMGPLRLEFTLPADNSLDYIQPGASGTTTVAIASDGDMVNVGLNDPASYCQANPDVVAACYLIGDPLSPGSNAAAGDAMASVDYNRSLANNSPNHVAFGDEIGPTWGLSYQRSSDSFFAATVLKRHSGYGPLGLGGIYRIDYSSGLPVVSNFIDVNTIGINTGIDPRAVMGEDPPNGNNPGLDNLTYETVGKAGIGDLDVSADDQTLWLMNLADKTLYSMDVGLTGSVPTASDVTSFPVPDPGCVDGDYHPWAVKYHQNKVYVGVVCSNETINPYPPGPPAPVTAADFIDFPNLAATVYEMDTSSGVFTQVLNVPLNHIRGCAQTGGGSIGCQWFPWTNLSTHTQVATRNGRPIHPQPVLSDIEFAEDGDMLLGFIDRTGLQYGVDSPAPNTTPGNTSINQAVTGGEMLRADFTGGTWTIESNGSAGSTPGAGIANGEGPGGGEFFSSGTSGHNELGQGGLAVRPGSGHMLSSALDPTAIFEGGILWMNNFSPNPGTEFAGYSFYRNGSGPTLAKGMGIGDVELRCEQAPIEIGNLVWFDTNRDGIQGPSEPLINGVTVTLHDMDNGGAQVGSALTGVNGQYLFGGIANLNMTVGRPLVQRNYEVRIDLNDGMLPSSFLTQQNANGIVDNDNRTDLADNDAFSSGGFAVIAFNTVLSGHNNHTLDFGFGIPQDFGDLPDPAYPTLSTSNGARHELPVNTPFLGACVDGDAEGQPGIMADGDDSGSSLYTDGTCLTVNDDEDGITDVQGLYVGNATASLDVLVNGSCALNAWVDFNQNGSLLDSGEHIFNDFPLTNGLNNDLIFSVPATATSGDSYARFRCATAGGLLPDGPALDGEVEDYVFTVAPVYSLGDFVWYDTNQDGIQDVGEPGVNGVTAELFDNATCTGVAVDSTTTVNGGVPAANGFYEFTGLSVQSYCVAFSNIPSGYVVSPSNQGVNDAVDSDADPSTAQIQNINLTGDDPTNDMGISLDGSIAGLTWCESTTNANTSYDAGDGDTLVPNIQVTLYTDANCSDTVDGGDAGSAITQNTGSPGGDYLFSDLPVGPAGNALCYITEVDPSDTDLGTCNNLITSQTLGPDLDVNNPDSTNNNFGFDENINLGDFVWYDTNQNGIQDAGEPGVNGVTAELFDNATCTGVAVDSTTTANGGVPAANGFYEFTGLATGSYCVAFSNIPMGYVISPINQGVNDAVDSDADPSTAQIQNINLTGDDPTNDMGISLDGSIAGLTWCESATNANTSYDVGDGDTLLPNIQVTLYTDANCSDTIDGGDAGSAVTQNTGSPGGDYLFSGLPVGPAGNPVCYITEVDAADPDLGVCDSLITDSQLELDLDVNNPDSTDNNFGFDENLSLGDYVWYDSNQNGQQDAGEPGVNGVTAELFDNPTCSGAATDVTTTTNGGVPAADGFYEFTGLSTDDYCVAFSNLPVDYQFTNQNVGSDLSDSDVDPNNGQIQNINLTADDPTNDAGVIALIGSIEGLVYCDDSPNNGTVDSGEEVAGVNIELLLDDDCDGNGDSLYANMLTIADGTFLFEQLPVGLAPVPPNSAVCYVATFDSQDPALDNCNVPITPESEIVELDTDTPNAPPVFFGVEVLKKVPVNDPWLLMLLLIGVLGVTFSQYRKH